MPTKTFIDLMTVYISQIQSSSLREEMEWALINMQNMLNGDDKRVPPPRPSASQLAPGDI